MRSFLIPLLVAVSVVSGSLSQPRGCSTNSECLRRGLPLRKPSRRWQAKRDVPMISVTAYFELSYLTNDWSQSTTLTSGSYQSIETSGNGLEVIVTYPEGATTPQSGLNLEIVDPAANGQYLALTEWFVRSAYAFHRKKSSRLIQTGPSSGDGSGISSTTADYLVLIGASATTLPGALPDNTIQSTLGTGAYLETAVWTYDPSTGAVSASWTRSLGASGNETVPLTAFLTEGPSPYFSGSETAFTAANDNYVAASTGLVWISTCADLGAECAVSTDCCSGLCAMDSGTLTCQTAMG